MVGSKFFPFRKYFPVFRFLLFFFFHFFPLIQVDFRMYNSYLTFFFNLLKIGCTYVFRLQNLGLYFSVWNLRNRALEAGLIKKKSINFCIKLQIVATFRFCQLLPLFMSGSGSNFFFPFCFEVVVCNFSF